MTHRKKSESEKKSQVYGIITLKRCQQILGWKQENTTGHVRTDQFHVQKKRTWIDSQQWHDEVTDFFRGSTPELVFLRQHICE